MEKRNLGNSGIKVHPVGLGLWAIGGTTWGETDDNESLAMIDHALELGVDFFDTADVYGDGHSEVLLGRAMKGRRDKFIVGTKMGWVGFDAEAGRSVYSSPEKIIQGFEENLKRLDTDYADLLQWHINFHDPTMGNFIEGAEKLKEQGKIRAYGVSTSRVEYLKSFFESSGADTLQNDYSILNRTSEQEIFPWCGSRKKGILVRGGLAMGLLTGKFSKDSQFSEGDFRKNWLNDPDQHRQYLEDLDRVDQLKKAFPGENLAQLAIRFILSRNEVSVMIAGAKRISQLEDNFLAAEKGLLNQVEQQKIDSIVTPGGGRKIWPA